MYRLKRKVDDYLINWKNDSNRYPLIIRGARQIGKTEAIEHFAKENYKNIVEINFALEKKYKDIKYGIKLCNKNIGFNGKFYTFHYFLTFLLKRYLKEKNSKNYCIKII